ncbi:MULTISPECIES: DUF3618 domain-containing protein [Actibacterium]|jgi:hypothetical protein|uniref:DUF3618 domain-containing protein n=1 Tax=Actibacterium naphthalenivorans TaxID=1614693 RepID=A0A840CFC8_9RHOB|nr:MULTISPECIES: DUF3618 domain-containing protein [Actibacterium]ALG92360.1 hypothetical protein TQ29_19355 [Actibacterium sp. EMB200-NS6]MBB4024010.1 hypothetical protein [Actibacterium naphthalenivorans]
MTDKRTPDEIERELERNRAALQDTIRTLESTFTPDTIFRSIADTVGRHGEDFGRSTMDAARANPLALGVTAVGLGWLMFGKGPSADKIADTASRASGSDQGDSRYGPSDTASFTPPRGPVPVGEIGPRSQGLSAAQKARAKWYRTENYVKYGANSASDHAGAARDGAAHARARVRDRSREFADQLSEGTERLSAEARERVIAARERAILAGESLRRTGGDINRKARSGADRAVEFFEENPLVAGALALAAGAFAAGSLPRTQFEDEHFGEHSDRLYDEAEALFQEERAKAERVAGAALDEARTIGGELRADADAASRRLKDAADRETSGDGSAADAAVTRAEDAVQRISDAAREQAADEDLGPHRG